MYSQLKITGGIFNVMDKFFTWIDTEVKANGWSYSELARRAGISRGAVSNTMNGHNALSKIVVSFLRGTGSRAS